MNTVPTTTHYAVKFPSFGEITGVSQYFQSAMDKPCSEKTTFVIMVTPLPGKYVFLIVIV